MKVGDKEIVFKVTCKSLIDFEDMTGIELLSSICDILKKFRAKVDNPEDLKDLKIDKIELAEHLSESFKGRLKNIVSFAYCSIKSNSNKISFNEFSELIDPENIEAIGSEVVNSFLNFFQKQTKNN